MPGTRKLGKTTDQRMAMLRQQVTDFLDKGKMETTVTRAKEIKPLAEKMITLGKKNDLAAYRQAMSFITREDVCKKLFDYLNAPIAHLLGDVLEPNCPAPWLNMPKFAYFHDKIVESYPTIETKEDFRDLLWSWFCYVNRINSWFYTVLPWELGKNLQRKDPDDVAQLADLLGYKLEKK